MVSQVIKETSYGYGENDINVSKFIKENVTPYYGDDSFVCGPTERTLKIWAKVSELMKEERLAGVLDADTSTPSSITSHKPGYIDKYNEIIVGLQTDAPLKRAIMPNGGYRMVETSCKAYGLPVDEELKTIYTKYRKTHNDGVFDVYTDEIRRCRHSAILTGLPDAYGRGRIIGDYRRIALYGMDRLIQEKIEDKARLDDKVMNEETIRAREELSEQIRALKDIKTMAMSYDVDISKPAQSFKEAVQFTYFGYLAAIKDQNGAAMSLGRVSSFLDIYSERDLAAGKITEVQAQEIMDDFVIKLRMVRFLRTPEYNELFSGDPVWTTESIGGMALDGSTLVTKNSYRMLQTLINLGPAPEPNMTVLWSNNLPRGFKEYCAKVSIQTSAVQYENDDLMRDYFGDDYAIACCVSPLIIGKEMQFFGARANLAKALLYTINGGVDERTGDQVAEFEPITDEILDYDRVMEKFDKVMDWLAKTYVSALNIIHYMHDKYNYEKAQLALMDSNPVRKLGCGIAGFSVVVDSLSAIKYSKVRPIRDEDGIAKHFDIEGDYPKYGNNDDRVDSIGVDLVNRFMSKIEQYETYRNAIPTQSILTITSNVVYGKKTGDTPDGRLAGVPFSPGANPFNGRDDKGALASLCSVAKLPFKNAKDGISNTFSILPDTLGKTSSEKIYNLVGLMDGYFGNMAQHLNVNVLDRETLEDAMVHPEHYPQLTIRVSGYAVNFVKLTREQQLDVISRTFHEKI
ncbi:formate C-acetyltransferase [bacterium]|nr:formate C-acetyltransferase [bacterium]